MVQGPTYLSLPACRRRQVSEPQHTKATHGPKSRGKSFGTTLWHQVQRYCCLGVLFAHAQVPSNSSSYHIRGNEMNCVGSSEYMKVFTSFTGASFFNMRADQSSSQLIRTLLPESTIEKPFSKMSKDGNTSPFFTILFLKNIWIYLRLIFFRTVQIKDSCIVDIKNRKFHLLFLRLI